MEWDKNRALSEFYREEFVRYLDFLNGTGIQIEPRAPPPGHGDEPCGADHRRVVGRERDRRHHHGQPQFGRGTGGPASADMTMTLDSLRIELAGLEFIHAEELDRNVVEGAGHTGIGAVVQVIARKPA